jgi:ring-1,2-phenylacetyl-CoA epoxidase subunit PaaC
VSHENAQALLEIADDELILGWRDSEWTGIAPSLEEDVAFSSIAQNEIGHARALYELAARELDTTADELAFDRSPGEYRSAPLVVRRLLDWAHTIARHYLYETADEIRLAALKHSSNEAVAGLAAKMDREEQYHRLHARMWHERLRDEPRYERALDELWAAAVAILEPDLRPALAERTGRPLPSGSEPHGFERGGSSDELRELWEEMTMVRRSVPGAAW